MRAWSDIDDIDERLVARRTRETRNPQLDVLCIFHDNTNPFEASSLANNKQLQDLLTEKIQKLGKKCRACLHKFMLHRHRRPHPSFLFVCECVRFFVCGSVIKSKRAQQEQN
jgi:hypothetical protein